MRTRKKGYWGAVIAILATSFAQLATSATTPALSAIADNFPQASSTAIAAIATLPSLTAIPMTMLAGMIAGRRISYRALCCIGILIQFVGGLLPFFASSIEEILICRVLLGLGTGLVSPLTTTVTLALFSGEELSKQVGRNSMASNVGAISFILLGGVLCNIEWRMPFLAYIILLPVFFVVLLLLPDTEKSKESKESKPEKLDFKSAVTGHLLFWSILYAIYMIFEYPFITELSSIITKSGIGDAVTCSVILCIYALFGVLGGKMFHKVNVNFGTRTLSLSFACGVVGYLIMLLAKNAWGFYAAAAIYGIGYGLNRPAITYFLGIKVKASDNALASSLYYIIGCIGTFASAYVMKGIKLATGTANPRASFAAGMIFYLVVTVFFLFFKEKGIPNTKQKESEGALER